MARSTSNQALTIRYPDSLEVQVEESRVLIYEVSNIWGNDPFSMQSKSIVVDLTHKAHRLRHTFEELSG